MTEIPSVGHEERKVLEALRKGARRLEEIARISGIGRITDVGAIVGKMKTKGLVEVKEKEKRVYSLSEEGKRYSEQGLPEEIVFRSLLSIGGKGSLEELIKASKLGKREFSIGLGWAFKKGIISKEGKEVVANVSSYSDPFSEFLRRLKEKGEVWEEEIPKEVMKEVKRRRDLFNIREEKEIEVFLTDLGKEALDKGEIEVGGLTPEMIRDGSWRKVKFKRYDLLSFVGVVYGGRVHPLTSLIRRIREIFVSMGFEEIKGDYVQSSFWNMDALYTPQDHPAREMQDTYYLVEPSSLEIPEDLARKIGEVHENGGDTGSSGWGYKWNKEIAKRALLRSHTTALTVKYLYEHKGEIPIRVFSIGRVFRRENLDPTHLSEFTQIEGIALERRANLRMLIGILKEFYRRMGFEEIKVRPSYFPYTEPSLEVFVKFKGSWLELGGAGIFRPEVTKPLGIEGRVLAWGLGLERLAAILLGLDDVRKLYLLDIGWLRKVRVRW